ncbi:SpoIIE family protein phosphatase [Streptomyces sp. NPDC051917]|uniref:SpoIIE family protein phosphatase n=1 Tax=Streptomyces sp. NPDC051917 TaxID=3154754 RepID=UPI003455A121
MDRSTETAIPTAQTTFEATGAIALLDADGVVVGWSQTAHRLVGYSAGEVVGHPASHLLMSTEDKAKAPGVTEEGGAHGRWSGSARLRHRDGHGIDVRLAVSSLSGQGERRQWVVSATDTTTPPPWEAAASVAATPHLPGNLPVGVVIRDDQLRCTWVNDSQGAKDGIPARQRLGRTLTEAAPGAESEMLEALMCQVLASGIPRVNVQCRGPFPPGTGEASSLVASFFRLDDVQGRALGVCTVIVDATDTRRARERLAILGEASKRIGTTLDVMRTAQELADAAVPLLADYTAVDLAQSLLHGEEPLARLGAPDGRIPVFRRSGLASVRPGAPESLFARGEPVSVPPTSPFTRVIRSGTSHFEPMLDASPGTLLDQQDAARAAAAREHTMHSLMVVPVHARGTLMGTAVFVRTENPLPFEKDDLLLAEELVSRAALSLDNACRYTRERSAALTLQRHLLPHHASGGPAADVAWRYLPADSHHGVGGDWFDVIPLSGARIALVVGDVIGHGIHAAATMGRLRTAVHTLASMDMPPEELLAHLDEQVIRMGREEADREDTAATIGATCLYAVYDPATQQCTMARAGHPPAAIIDPDGAVTFPELPAGLPLGLGGVPFESVTLKLPENSVLALYTDGLIETRNLDIDVGMNRLAAALARPGLPLEELCSAAVDTLPARTPEDDITLLLARTRALDPTQVASWQFQAQDEKAVVSHARTLVARQLSQWGLEHLVESTQLIVSELVTNAILHGSNQCDRQGAIGLRLLRHEVLTCEVSDTSDCHPRLRHPRTTEESGRGLFLVTQLSDRWGTRLTPDGKLIWAEQRLPPGR